VHGERDASWRVKVRFAFPWSTRATLIVRAAIDGKVKRIANPVHNSIAINIVRIVHSVIAEERRGLKVALGIPVSDLNRIAVGIELMEDVEFAVPVKIANRDSGRNLDRGGRAG
jgi:hypothetical protein